MKTSTEWSPLKVHVMWSFSSYRFHHLVFITTEHRVHKCHNLWALVPWDHGLRSHMLYASKCRFPTATSRHVLTRAKWLQPLHTMKDKKNPCPTEWNTVLMFLMDCVALCRQISLNDGSYHPKAEESTFVPTWAAWLRWRFDRSSFIRARDDALFCSDEGLTASIKTHNCHV